MMQNIETNLNYCMNVLSLVYCDGLCRRAHAHTTGKEARAYEPGLWSKTTDTRGATKGED